MSIALGAKGQQRQSGAQERPALRRWAWAELGVIVLAAVLRLYGIGRESLWLDEATSLMLARMPLHQMAAWTALDLHPPLYYALLRAWIALLGESEFAVRGLSALASVLTVAVLCHLGYELFDRATGVMAALLLAVSPYAIWYAQEARMYACLALLVTVMLWLALVALRGGHWSAWAGYVLAGAAALYTHYYAFFGLGIANLLFLYLALRGQLDRRRIWRWIAAQVAVLLLFAPWLPTLLKLALGGGGGWLGVSEQRPGLVRLAHTAIFFMLGGTSAALPTLLRRAAYALFALALLVGLWPRRRSVGEQDSPTRSLNTSEAAWFCLACVVLPVGIAWVVSQVRPMYSERYMLPFQVPFLLLAAWGLRRVPVVALRVGLTLLLVVALLVGVVAQVRTLDKPDWRGLAAEISAQAQPGDMVLFVPGWHAKPFDYYAQGKLALYADIPVPVPQQTELALNAVAQAVAGHSRVWLIWETDHYTDPDGQVLAWLDEHLRRVSERPLDRLGRVILFEREGE